jgi:hypothetical protein
MAPDLQGAQTKECAVCGQAVERALLACPKCGGGIFAVAKTYATSSARVLPRVNPVVVGRDEGMPMSAGRRFDVSLYGDNLQAWQVWVASLQDSEWLLRWAMRINKAAILGSLPLWMVATLISIPLTFISMLAFGHLFLPFHWLIVRPLTFLVVWTSQLWTAAPVARPLLLLVGPLIVAVALVMIRLIPDMNVDFRESRHRMCDLWPLSSRRLQWIAERGTGGPQV